MINKTGGVAQRQRVIAGKSKINVGGRDVEISLMDGLWGRGKVNFEMFH